MDSSYWCLLNSKCRPEETALPDSGLRSLGNGPIIWPYGQILSLPPSWAGMAAPPSRNALPPLPPLPHFSSSAPVSFGWCRVSSAWAHQDWGCSQLQSMLHQHQDCAVRFPNSDQHVPTLQGESTPRTVPTAVLGQLLLHYQNPKPITLLLVQCGQIQTFWTFLVKVLLLHHFSCPCQHLFQLCSLHF